MPRKRKTKKTKMTLSTPKPTLMNLPPKITLLIIELLDMTSLATFRLVNKNASELGKALYFSEAAFNRDSIDEFTFYQLPCLKRICFSSKLFKHIIAWILNDCSLVLKSVSLTLKPNVFILKELAKCRNLEELNLDLYGNASEWDGLDEQFFENEQYRGCWRNVRKLKINGLERAGFYISDIRCDFNRMIDLVPNVEDLEIRRWSFDPELLPTTIKKLSVPLLDRALLVRVLRRLPELTELRLFGILGDLILPSQPNLTITHFLWDCVECFENDTLFLLGTWTRLFPNLRHLSLDSPRLPSPPFKIDDIKTESAMGLRGLRLLGSGGPNILELMNAFPGLTELDVSYEAVLPGSTDAPLADFRNLKKLAVMTHIYSGNMHCRGWLQESILHSCNSANRNDFMLKYGQFRYSDVDLAILPFLARVSEVSKSISFKLYSLFNPEWLETLTHVMELDFDFYDVQEEIDAEQWSAVVQRLNNRGIKVSGNFAGINGLIFVDDEYY